MTIHGEMGILRVKTSHAGRYPLNASFNSSFTDSTSSLGAKTFAVDPQPSIQRFTSKRSFVVNDKVMLPSLCSLIV